jgi:hypothetical protein
LVQEIFDARLRAREARRLPMYPRGGISTLAPRGPDAAVANATSICLIGHKQARIVKRDLYAEASARIVAELEAGAAP